MNCEHFGTCRLSPPKIGGGNSRKQRKIIKFDENEYHPAIEPQNSELKTLTFTTSPLLHFTYRGGNKAAMSRTIMKKDFPSHTFDAT